MNEMSPTGLAVLRGDRSRWYTLGPDRLSLVFQSGTPFEQWEAETTALMEVSRGIQWMVGDALAWGEATYGERAAQVFDPLGYSYDSLVRMAWTARCIPPERRSASVPFDLHTAVAALPTEEQERLLDHAAANGTRREEMRLLVRLSKQQAERARTAKLPAPQLDLDGIVIGQADAAQLPLPDASVDLIVTSPPYALDKPYGAGDVSAPVWPTFMHDWLVEALRVTKPSGRLALNVPLDTSIPEARPTYVQAVALALAAGWTYQSTLVWHEDNTTKGNRALGSVNSSARPHPVAAVEMIGLLSKGDWGPSSSRPDDISPEQWQLYGRGVWTFAGESHPWEAHPSAFPLELPRRLIRYLSRVGDTVLDPFVGSGTTAVAAYTLGRRCYGYDIDPQCVASAQRRMARAAGQP